jgi:glutamyl-tRNA(Gln) amidotransferase subunit E
VKKHVEATDDDTLIIVWASDDDIQTAVNEIIIRSKEAAIGIPSETRQALSDGTNGFERILPGADRMYPDTDLPPKQIAPERINKIKSWMPEQFWKRQQWYKELNIPPDTIDELSISKYAELFKNAVNEWKINPVTAAVVLIQYPKRLSRSGYVIDSINEEMMSSILKSFAERKLTYDFILTTLKISTELGMFVEEIIPEPINDKELEKEIVIAEQKMQEMEFIKEENVKSILMGILMSKLRGKISAKKVAEKVSSLQRSLKNVK